MWVKPNIPMQEVITEWMIKNCHADLMDTVIIHSYKDHPDGLFINYDIYSRTGWLYCERLVINVF